MEEQKIKKFEDFPTSKSKDFEEIKEVKPEELEKKKISDWILLISAAAIIIIIALIMILKPNKEEAPKTIDDLHLLNLNGKLKPEAGYVHNGYSFVFNNGLWYTQVQTISGTNLFDVPLHYGPRDLEDIPVEGQFNAVIFNSERNIYITFDPLGQNLQYVALAVSEFDQSIVQAFNKIPIASCDKNETLACSDRPIITCENKDIPILYVQQKEETKVIFNDNCIIVQGQGPEIVRSVDRLLLKLYGIMP